MSLVSVIILNWNGVRHLDACLGSLEQQDFRDFETILVDNGSSDGSVAHVRERYPWVRLVALEANTGFSEGNNRGLAACRGEYLVTLNNDTKAEPGFLAALVHAVQTDRRVGMVAAKMLNFYQTSRIDSVGIAPTRAGMGKNRGVGESDDGRFDQPVEVFGPCAGAALYRRAMLEEVGFFDADFFAYYEDVDLAWRGRLAGWRCVTAPGAVVYHVHSATSGRMSPFTVFQIQRNKWYVLIKDWPAPLLVKHLPGILLYDLAALALAVARGRGAAALRARAHVVRALPALLEKRGRVQALRTITPEAAERLLESGGSPWQTFRRKWQGGV